MNKLLILLISIAVLNSCTIGKVDQPEPTTTTSTLSESEARKIAEENCIKGGESIEPGYYNENSKTWWFDANLNATQPGCNPACVVFEETKETEINWRCTGLLPQENAAENAIQSLFQTKYPKYADSLQVEITNEADEHARGNIIFERGQPGGLFLAVKKDGDWQIVFDGNGQISCNLKEYGFPDDMLFDCAE